MIRIPPLSVFENYRAALIGQPVSLVWRGYGSALFFEFGTLLPKTETRRDGSPLMSDGDHTLLIEWSWRIEDETSILFGSWSDDTDWDTALNALCGRTVTDICLFGRLPELSVQLSGGVYVVSFMTAEGQPSWAMTSRTLKSIGVDNGQIVVEDT